MRKSVTLAVRCVLVLLAAMLHIAPVHAADTQKPTTPTGLSGAVFSSTQIDLTWSAATDDVGVTGYRIFRNGAFLTQVAATNFSNSGLTANTSYTYTVSALDAAGNESPQSSPAVITTVNPATYAAAAYGQTRTGTLVSDTAVARYAFTAAAGDKIVIPFGMTTPDQYMDITLRLFDPSGILVSTTSTNYDALAELTATAAKSGSYSLWISAADTAGNGRYTFTLQKVNAPAGAAAILYGNTKTGTTGITGLKAYTFTAAAGDKLLVPFWSTDSNNYFGLRVRIWDGAGNKIADMSGAGLQEVTAIVAAAGTCVLLVSGVDGYGDTTLIGSYTFTLQKLNTPAGAAGLPFNSLKTGTTAGATFKVYTFNAAAGDRVVVPFWSTDADNFFTLRVRIFDSAGFGIADLAGEGFQELASSIPATGTYFILISGIDSSGDGSGTGSYTFSFQRLNSPAGAIGTAYGTTKTGTVPAVGLTAYTFNAAAGDKVILPFWSTDANHTFELRVRIFNAAGLQVADMRGYDAQELSTSISAAGTYSILLSGVDGNGDFAQSGSYTFSLQRLNSPGGVSGLPFNTVKSDAMAPGAAKSYIFNAAAGDKVIVPFWSTDNFSVFNLRVRIFSSTGAAVADMSGTGNQELNAALPAAGTYLLMVTGANVDNYWAPIASYTVGLQRLNNPGGASVLAYGGTATGTTTVGAFNTYIFTATAGDKVIVPIVGVGSPDSFLTRARLVDSTGVVVADAQARGGELTELAASLATGGRYTLLVNGFDEGNGLPTGSFELTLQRLNNPGAAVAIGYNTLKKGTLGLTAPAVFKFNAAAGDRLVLPYGVPADYSGASARIRICDAAGILVLDKSGISGELHTALPAAGTYSVFVSGVPPSNAITYELLLKKVGWPTSTALTLETSRTVSMVLDEARMDVYSLNLSAGDLISLGYSIDNYLVNAAAYDSSGNLLAFEEASPGGTLLATAPTTGQYFLTISYATFSQLGPGTYTMTIGLNSVSNVTAFPQFFDPAAGQTTSIKYDLARNSNVTITMYRASLVNGAPELTSLGTVFSGTLNKGNYTYVWSGKDANGAILPGSAYVYAIDATEIGGPTHYVYNPPYIPGSVAITSPTMAPLSLNPYMGQAGYLSYGLAAPAWVHVNIGLVNTVTMWPMLAAVPREASMQAEPWTGRDTGGNIIPAGTYKVMAWADILPENSIVVRVANPMVISQLVANPYAIYPAYGQMTNITYSLSKGAAVTLVVKHPVTGNIVRTMVNGITQAAGTYSVVWDGRDAAGKAVGTPGNYPILLTTVDAGNQTVTRSGNITVFK